MTFHARTRIAERYPDLDPGEVLDACLNNSRHYYDQVMGDKPVYIAFLKGQVFFPVIAEDGTVLTVLEEGMTIQTPTHEQILEHVMDDPDDRGIITLLDGEPVQCDGAYRCSMSHYHSQHICPGPSVSSTGIRKAALHSPHAFWMSWDGNPNRYPEKEISDALILGRAAHSLLLGDEVFDDHFIYVPSDAPQRPTATQIAAYERTGVWSESAAPRAEFWTEFDEKAKGRMLLKQEAVERIMYMAENLKANPACVELLTSNLTEVSMIWQDQATGLWIKSRPDCIPDNGYDISDLKSFSPKGGDLTLSAMRAVTDHGYALQMALAIEGAENVFGTTATRCALVFTQTTEPYEPIPIEIDEESLYWARVLNRHGIDRIAHGLRTGEWPGRATEIKTYSYPPSMMHRFGEMQLSGEIPNIGR